MEQLKIYTLDVMCMIHDGLAYFGIQKKQPWINIGGVPNSGSYSKLMMWHLLDIGYIETHIDVKDISVSVKTRVTDDGRAYLNTIAGKVK